MSMQKAVKLCAICPSCGESHDFYITKGELKALLKGFRNTSKQGQYAVEKALESFRKRQELMRERMRKVQELKKYATHDTV